MSSGIVSVITIVTITPHDWWQRSWRASPSVNIGLEVNHKKLML
jgi:hypothetical protein